MLPGDRLVCALVEPQTVGMQFKTWLLHVTIVPWFRVDSASGVVAEGLSRALRSVRPFEATAGEDALLGPHKDRTVSLVRQPTPFTQIEAKVRTYLHKKRAWLADETTKKHYEFRPHVTVQGEGRLYDGNTFWCDRLYIVEQKDALKEVVAEVRLGS